MENNNLVNQYYYGYDDQLLNKKPSNWFPSEQHKIAYFLGWTDASNDRVVSDDSEIYELIQKIC